ncbi:MAG: hypothetical protein IPK16_14800 [Anaerolineales bacterium]|nr:hypothetical protein [Anaerolineales bacterium]
MVATAFNLSYNTRVRDKTTKQEAIDAAMEEAVKWGEANLARPEISEWRVAGAKAGSKGWKVKVQAEKTNYVVDRIIADEQGKRLNPPESDATYYGISTFGDPVAGATAAAAGVPGSSTSELLGEWLTLDRALADPFAAG